MLGKKKKISSAKKTDIVTNTVGEQIKLQLMLDPTEIYDLIKESLGQ